jgi:mono/diheme cytochrome c family protein
MIERIVQTRARIALLSLGAIALTAGAAAAALAGWVWWKSEAHLRSFANPPDFATAIPKDKAAIARGRHIAQTRGCLDCHGHHLEGQPFHSGSWGFNAVAANIALLAKQESPAALERAIRHGIGHDGKALYSMPSYNFIRLRDDDLADLIAFIRSVPARDSHLAQSTLGWEIRWDIATGKDAAIAAFISKVPPLTFQSHPDPAVRRGEYLAMTSCNECHGFGLRGDNPFDPPGQGPPDLVIAGSYAKPDFIRFMRTGRAAGDRELRMMSDVARVRFSHWTDSEVDDLYAFLQAMSAKAIRSGS